jgi:hypothetical protein
MALPKQVQRQIEEVEELERQMQAPVDKDKDTPKMEVVSEDGQTTETEEENTEDLDVAASAEDETPTQPNEPETSEVDWEHKYHRLQGKYDAEVPRLHQQLKDLAAQLEDLREQAKKPAEKPEDTVVEKLVTDADVEEYGKEFIDLQRRIAKEAIQGDLAALKAENAKLKAELDQTGSQVGEVSFEARLHRLVPDFADINNNPEWIEWLDTVDPIIRAPRRAVAQDAFNRGDAEAVAHYVSLFRGNEGAAPVKPDRSSELKRQVQPSKTVSSNAPVSQKGRTYSSADIDGMFRKITEYSSRQQFDKATKLEAEIDAAFREGRVQV